MEEPASERQYEEQWQKEEMAAADGEEQHRDEQTEEGEAHRPAVLPGAMRRKQREAV